MFLLLPCFMGISVFKANSVDSDQTPRCAASDLGLHCVPMPFDGPVGINVLKHFTFTVVIVKKKSKRHEMPNTSPTGKI